MLSVLVESRVRAEVVASLGNAKIKGNGARTHAAKRATSEARSVLSNIAYHSTNPDYEASKEESENWLLTSEIEREIRRNY